MQHKSPRSDNQARQFHHLRSQVRSLQKSRHRRDSCHRFWIEGIRQFVQAFDAGWDFETVVHSRVLLKSSLAQMLVRRLAARGVARAAVTPEEFRSVSIAERASGIGAIVKQRWTPLQQIDPRQGLCWLVVEWIRSPGNLGSILRTAEAVGAAGAIFLGEAADPFDPAVVRASMGGLFPLHLVRTTHEHLSRWAKSHGVMVVGLSPDAPQLWTDPLPAARPLALLIGEEREGVSASGAALCERMVRLPMSGRADSINVSVASGVMLYELVRGRAERET
jgi:TrmH family RNA methyltransferase